MKATLSTSTLLKKVKVNLYNILLTSTIVILISFFFGSAILSQ
jgi:hypothetical protein